MFSTTPTTTAPCSICKMAGEINKFQCCKKCMETEKKIPATIRFPFKSNYSPSKFQDCKPIAGQSDENGTEATNQHDGGISSLHQECTNNRFNSIDALIATAEHIESFMLKPIQKNGALRKLLVCVTIFCLPYCCYLKENCKSTIEIMQTITLTASITSLMCATAVVTFKKSTDSKLETFLSLVIDGTSSACGVLALFVLLNMIIWQYTIPLLNSFEVFSVQPDQLVAWVNIDSIMEQIEVNTGYLLDKNFCVFFLAVLLAVGGILFTLHSKEKFSEKNKLLAFSHSDIIKQMQEKLAADWFAIKQLTIVLFRAEAGEVELLTTWSMALTEECPSKIKGIIKSASHIENISFSCLKNLYKGAGKANSKECLCQQSLRLILPSMLVPFELMKYLTKKVEQGEDFRTISRDIRQLATELQQQLKQAWIGDKYLVYHPCSEMNGNWNYLAFPPLSIDELEKWIGERRSDVLSHSSGVNEILRRIHRSPRPAKNKNENVNKTITSYQNVDTIG